MVSSSSTSSIRKAADPGDLALGAEAAHRVHQDPCPPRPHMRPDPPSCDEERSPRGQYDAAPPVREGFRRARTSNEHRKRGREDLNDLGSGVKSRGLRLT